MSDDCEIIHVKKGSDTFVYTIFFGLKGEYKGTQM